MFGPQLAVLGNSHQLIKGTCKRGVAADVACCLEGSSHTELSQLALRVSHQGGEVDGPTIYIASSSRRLPSRTSL